MGRRKYDFYNFNFCNLIIEIESSFFQLSVSTIYYIRCILKFFIFYFFVLWLLKNAVKIMIFFFLFFFCLLKLCFLFSIQTIYTLTHKEDWNNNNNNQGQPSSSDQLFLTKQGCNRMKSFVSKNRIWDEWLKCKNTPKFWSFTKIPSATLILLYKL